MADDAADSASNAAVDGWLLAGGEGRRMGGQDKGLLAWHGRPLAWTAASRLAPQVRRLTLNANRHPEVYAAWGWAVQPDEPGLPPGSGPLAGILTGLRCLQASWLQLAPCDSPLIPADLTATLYRQALTPFITPGFTPLTAPAATQADRPAEPAPVPILAQVAVPVTVDPGTGETRHHWTCALVHRSTLPLLEGLFSQGERRVGAWVRRARWIGVCFDRPAAFANINTPETLHGTPSA